MKKVHVQQLIKEDEFVERMQKINRNLMVYASADDEISSVAAWGEKKDLHLCLWRISTSSRLDGDLTEEAFTEDASPLFLYHGAKK